MKAFLKAVEYNWGLIGPGTWMRVTYSVYESGLVKVSNIYLGDYDAESGKRTDRRERYSYQLSAEAVDLLHRSIAALQTGYKPFRRCDGTAWNIKAYDPDGEIIYKYETAYIYGVNDLEQLIAIITDGDSGRRIQSDNAS